MATLAPPFAPPEPIAGLGVPPELDAEAAAWSLPTRIAFRFCLIYFGAYVITTQMLQGMLPFMPTFGTLPPTRGIVLWVGRHLLGFTGVSIHPTGSGDTAYDWSQAFTLLLLAAVGTVIWSVAARGKLRHPRLFAWFRFFLRLAVGTTFLGYGFAKAIPTQMPVLTLTRLVEPFGNFSPMGVLWYSVGASPAYEIATGSAEVLAGILLIVPRLATAGALVALMDATMIFLLNMTYDVPVKLFSFHLVLMSLFLLAPMAPRFVDLFVLHRPSAIPAEPALGRSRAAQRAWSAVQIVYGLVMIGLLAVQGVRGWHQYGGGAPKSPLYGIWEVEEMSIGGVVHPALLTDSTRWRRVIMQSPTAISFQAMNDSFRRYGATIDTTTRQLVLTPPPPASPTPRSLLTYTRPDHDHLAIDGELEGKAVHLALKFRDPDSFLQRSRGFNWVQELPFNR